MRKKNTRIFSLTVSVFFALSIVGSLLSIGAGTAHAATSSTTHTSTCGSYHANYGYIYDTRGTGTYLGEVEILVDGCGDANAWIYPAQSDYHTNHLWIRDAGNNNVSWDAGGVIGSTDTGWWSVNSSCARAVGVIQYGNMWGNGWSGCISPN